MSTEKRQTIWLTARRIRIAKVEDTGAQTGNENLLPAAEKSSELSRSKSTKTKNSDTQSILMAISPKPNRELLKKPSHLSTQFYAP
jgi:hypothetical protein